MLHDFKPADDGLDKAQRKAEIDRLREKLAAQQQSVMAAKLPVVVLVEGWDCAGKGHLINELISEMDPRFYRVAVYKRVPENEERYPFLRKFFEPLPENGKFLFMDTGWMEDCVYKYLRREITAEEYERRVDACNIFERQLRDNGYIVVKLFLHISREEQLSRIAELRENIDTEWRVTGDDLWQHKEYKAFRRAYGEFMEKTSVCGEWHVLDAGNRKKRLLAGFRAITEAIDNGLENGRCIGKAGKNDFPLLGTPSLRDADLTKSVAPEEYKAELKRLQEKLAALHNKIYRKRIPVVICYEGWDAAGKGGNIRRLAYPLDPRGFDVIPIASPTPGELARHYLWRFWTRLPRSGHVTIFDRSWYGRVMVERIEGWDAAGKGGNIRRLAYPLDPRGFDVIPIASPTPGELARHYLWRFWTRLPRSGHVTIFDRSWYGRVMVERIEGYCGEDDWKRAYGEINEFEKELADYGTIVLKFWIHIDPETQLERFELRQNTPEKQWKITDEDWRNREKWPLYETAVEEMLQKTSTAYAPWHIIESVDKKYARIRVLQIVTDALEQAVNEHITRGVKKECAKPKKDRS